MSATAPLVVASGQVSADWVVAEDGAAERLWYRQGDDVILVDPVARTRVVCDDEALASLGVSAAPTARGAGSATAANGAPLTLSPDGNSGAFVKDFNLWVHDIGTGIERQLTTDGVQDFGYATDNAGWKHSDRAVLLWSDDGTKIATQQQDERNVGEWHMVKTMPGHPELESWKYPLPGDSVVAMCHRVVVDVPSGTTVRLQMPPDYHRATIGDDISMGDYAFSPDGTQLALVSTPRDHSGATLRVADTATGVVRDVLSGTTVDAFSICLLPVSLTLKASPLQSSSRRTLSPSRAGRCSGTPTK